MSNHNDLACPYCRSKAKTHKYSMTTLLAHHVSYDENGNTTSVDPNKTTDYYVCNTCHKEYTSDEAILEVSYPRLINIKVDFGKHDGFGSYIHYTSDELSDKVMEIKLLEIEKILNIKFNVEYVNPVKK